MKTFLNAAFGLALLTTVHVPFAHSQERDPVCETNPADLFSVDGYCTLTPETYGVNIYEMGLCETNPISSGSFSANSCEVTLSNITPIAANMANGNSLILKSEKTLDRPRTGEYGFAYIIIEDDFRLKFSYTLNNIVYYSNGVNSSSSFPVNNVKSIAPSEPFVETLNNFGGPEGFLATASAIVEGGTINALLTDNNLTAATSAASVTRLIGVYIPTSKVKITDDTVGLEVQFVVTNQGGGLEGCDGDNTKVCRFGSGPFSAKFKPF
jgi:hypothetical protein